MSDKNAEDFLDAEVVMEKLNALEEGQATLQSMLNDLLGRLQSGSDAGSPGPPQLDEGS